MRRRAVHKKSSLQRWLKHRFKLARTRPWQSVTLLITAGLLVMLGIVIMRSRATVPNAWFNTNRGYLTDPAVEIVDSSAANGSYVRFAGVCHTPQPSDFPPPGTGIMASINWSFGKQLSDIEVPVTLANDAGPSSHLFLQAYDGLIDGTSQYFGIQTLPLVIFSRFGTTDTSNIRLGPNSFAVAGTTEGPFISLRNSTIPVTTGRYVMHLKRGEFDGTGDWFDYYLTPPGQTTEIYIGGIRFPRQAANVAASLADGGGSWTEAFDNNNQTTLFPVAYWDLNFSLPQANTAAIKPFAAHAQYSTMPNSDIAYQFDEQQFRMQIGASTPRCNPPDQYFLTNPTLAGSGH